MKNRLIRQVEFSEVQLLPGIFKDRYDVNKKYLLELNKQALLQNFYLEAGIVMEGLQVLDHPETANLHWGWEAPTCQLRGHFLGHWLSAASMVIAIEDDKELRAKLECIIEELSRCQQLNGGEWIGSIPEKYFQKLEKDQYVWSPQYVMHKTMLGLLHAYRFCANAKALEILSNSADWYLKWTADMEEKNPHAVYSGEEGGMLEVWAWLYELTKQEKYRVLADRYSHPSIFKKLEENLDVLTNTHANASIPWAHGSAKMYEITGEDKWLLLTKKFYNLSVNQRESYCTGGQNAGEFWVAPRMLSQFMGDRNQEFCTVYNMVRLADYLYRFTKEKTYLDYIEKNLYNGFLAQQNKYTGMPTYFLPMKKGSKKKWGSKTHDFWCCHGTMVQAQAIYPQLCYYQDEEEQKIVVGQYIPSEVELFMKSARVHITQQVDMKYYNDLAFFDEHEPNQMSRWLFKFQIKASTSFTLSFRVPKWLKDKPIVYLNGKVEAVIIEDGFIQIEREWKEDEVRILLKPQLVLEALPDLPHMAAVLEGPIVLAGIQNKTNSLQLTNQDINETLQKVTEHTYSNFPWLQSCYRTVHQNDDFEFVPLYDITDEEYTLYFQMIN